MSKSQRSKLVFDSSRQMAALLHWFQFAGTITESSGWGMIWCLMALAIGISSPARGAETNSPGEDNPSRPIQISFSQPIFNLAESGQLRVTVRLDRPATTPVSVIYTTTDGTALAGSDYVAAAGTLTFQPGETTQDIVTHGLIDDTEQEVESFFITLTNPSAGAEVLAALAEVRLWDSSLVLQFAAQSPEVSESDGLATVEILLLGQHDHRVTVDFAAEPATAEAGLDFIPVHDTLSFAPGVHRQTISIRILNDVLFEQKESVRLVLRNPEGAPLADRENFLGITDNDQLTVSPLEVPEDAGSVEITITRSGDVGAPVELIYVTEDGPAPETGCWGCAGNGVAGINFGLQAGLLAFAGGETSKTFTLPIYDNSVVQGDRSFLLRLFQDSRPLAPFTIMILDNEIPSQIDLGFAPALRSQTAGDSPSVAACAIQPDGRLLIGGKFITSNATNLARLHPDGSPDLTFRADIGAPNVWPANQSESVRALALQSDGRIVVGGDFVTINGKARSGLARLNPDGTLDINFNAGVSLNRPASGFTQSLVETILIQTDGGILIGGRFDAVNGVGRTNIARLRRDGSVDSGFTAKVGPEGLAGEVKSLAQDPRGRILVGVDTWEYGGSPLCRLNADGSRDTQFVIGGEFFSNDLVPRVDSIQLHTDGALLISGNFDYIGEVPRTGVAWLTSEGALASTLGADVDLNRSGKLATANLQGLLSATYLARQACVFGVSCYYTLVTRWNSQGQRDLGFPPVRAVGTPQVLMLDLSGDFLLAGTDNGFVRIHTNPQRPVIRFACNPPDGEIATPLAHEGDGAVTLMVERTGASDAALSVDYSTRDGTARAAVNYTAVAGSLHFAPLEIRKALTIPILSDAQVTRNLTFEVTLANPTGGAGLVARTIPVSIFDQTFGFPMHLIRRLPDGQLQFEVSNTDFAIVIEGSNDLVSWNKIPSAGIIRLPPSSPQRFFRARQIGP